ncbi:DNA-directed RNA polymerase IV subunit 1 isoform X1 [Fagus crenata]
MVTHICGLYFHPRRDEKFVTGAEDIKDIKVVWHPMYQNTRCFEAAQIDGTSEDFSYHKCALGSAEGAEVMALKKAMELALREEWPPVHLKGVSKLMVESVASKESPLTRAS